MKGRRSSRVQLVALGTVMIGGCSGDIPDNRFVYPNRSACVTEWGETNCAQGPSSGSGYMGLGPRYGSWVNLPSGARIWSGTPETPSFHPQTGKHLGASAMRGSSGSSASRGGFGSSGHSFGSSSGG